MRVPSVGAPLHPRWIVQAKRDTTRALRVEETARLAQTNESSNQWRPVAATRSVAALFATQNGFIDKPG
ncbi:MAG TPA: hypothetical protein VFQ15_09735 [Jiangellaceae bacterium]|nr:hypothetical protein [Jiangellaceae bacterium]